MFQKIVFSWLIIFLISLYPLEIISHSIINKQLEHGVRGVQLNKENLKYLNYIKNIHHVRDVVQWYGFTGEFNENNNLLFSSINAYGLNIQKDQIETLLINGDSWAEMSYWKQIPNNILQKYSLETNSNVVAAGISSFSPSPMLLQLRILRRDFNINPTKIISFFDYTDFGDELCRYKKNLTYKENKLTSIRPENYNSIEVYSDLLLLLNKYKIYYDENLYNIQKLFLYGTERLKYQFTKKESTMRCGWSQISKYLKSEISEINENHIKKVTIDYFEEVFEDNNVKKLYIVIHPHRNHFYKDGNPNKYVINWKPLLEKIINEKNLNRKITIIDFNDFYPEIYLDKGIKLQDIFIKEDISSHLVEEAHGIMMNKIFSLTKNSD